MKSKLEKLGIFVLTMVGYAVAGAIMAILGIVVETVMKHYLW